MKRVRRRLLVRGVVQGVGFRPFVYREATSRGLGGSVRNRGDAGVEICVEGPRDAVDSFVEAITRRPPPLARVEAAIAEDLEPTGDSAFAIAPSADAGAVGGAIPPDTAICPDCVRDVQGSGRFHEYWATSCTNCGPRFTVIEGLPYDRPLTSMRDFPLCPACEREYRNPEDRRYHAQTTACPACGPRLTFDGAADQALPRAIRALREGRIVAVKGLGGTHLACDARSEAAATELRRRLHRSGQPFALMAREEDLATLARVRPEEFDLLRSPQRPIVVLKQRLGALPAVLAPGLDSIGIMLPYSGLHVLLLDGFGGPLIMTSANLPGRPMLITNEDIERRLRGIADHVLLHDRQIVARCDDSVVRRAGGRAVFIRRSRGFTPERFPIDLGGEPILALGPETGATFALYGDRGLVVSQHIGSVNNLESLAFLCEAVDHLERLLGGGQARRLACDLHPRFMTSQLARELAGRRGGSVVAVQHHVAHFVSVVAEHDLAEAVGVVLDGYGYGVDGSAWGGELFVARDRIVSRAGSLRPVPLPGGDLATRYPLRVAAGYLATAGVATGDLRASLVRHEVDEAVADVIAQQTARRVNAPETTSAGRFLDAVAAWLGVCRERTYEGEPAMRLEAAAQAGSALEIPVGVRELDGRVEVDLVTAFSTLAEMRSRGAATADLAATAQMLLARGTAEAAVRLARGHGIQTVCLSGGVAVNDAIATEFRRRVEAAGLDFKTNEWVPCGDGGVSFGQAVFAGGTWHLEV